MLSHAIRLSGLCLLGILAAAPASAADRYGTALEIARNYSFATPPLKLRSLFASGAASKDAGFLSEVIRNPLFRGKFVLLSRELDRNHYANAQNISYLDDVRASLSRTCQYERFPNPADPDISVSCGPEYQYSSPPNRYLHTRFGDFIVAQADFFRGNGSDSNKNASSAILVVDLSDNNIGLTTEDKIAVSAGRKDILGAVLTFAAAEQRVASAPGSAKSPDAIAANLKSARAGKLFR